MTFSRHYTCDERQCGPISIVYNRIRYAFAYKDTHSPPFRHPISQLSCEPRHHIYPGWTNQVQNSRRRSDNAMHVAKLQTRPAAIPTPTPSQITVSCRSRHHFRIAPYPTITNSIAPYRSAPYCTMSTKHRRPKIPSIEADIQSSCPVGIRRL